MPQDEDAPDWYKKRRYPSSRDWFFEDPDKIFREMEKMMEEEFKAFTSHVPKDCVRERKLPDGSTSREWGPFVYGHTMKIGPDGKPQVREFGNVKLGRLGPEVKEEREPLVDVIETNEDVHIVAELPGVEKNDIKLHATEEALSISVDTPQRKYYKEVKFPAKVTVKEARTQYKNGILEITLPKTKEEKEPKGEPIRIE
jgi:HSP20 family protein